jgi:hypothetical protein
LVETFRAPVSRAGAAMVSVLFTNVRIRDGRDDRRLSAA